MNIRSANLPLVASGTPTKIGAVITAIWILTLAVYIAVSWPKVAAMEPNEIGDALAGVFAPIAFLWLVLGFHQQGTELRNSSIALQLQGEELRNSVEQQRELVNVTREQLAFESRRISNEKAQFWRRSQPNLELSQGGSLQSGSYVRQDFIVTNHGRPCTRVELDFRGRMENRKSTKLETGEEMKFTLDLEALNHEDFSIDATYLDNDLISGRTTFHLSGKFPKFNIIRESTALTSENDPSLQD